MTRSAAVASGALFLLAVTSLAERPYAQGAIEPFTVGVVTGNHAILPFASFDGQRWQNNWPEPGETAPQVMRLDQIPRGWWDPVRFQPAWESLEVNGTRRALQISGTAPTNLGSGCAQNLGLLIDGPGGTFGPPGLASSRAGAIAPVKPLAHDSSTWREIAQLLPGMFRAREASIWAPVPPEGQPDFTKPVSGPMLTLAFRSSDDQGEYVYFEAQREYRVRPDQLGEASFSVVSGWLWRQSASAQFQTVEIAADSRDQDGKGQVDFHPLGVVTRAGRRFWLGERTGYAYSAMTVIEVWRGGTAEQLLAPYPGC